MNKTNLNEDKNIRNNVKKNIWCRKNIIGIITGIILTFMMISLTSANPFNSTTDATENDINVVKLAEETPMTTATVITTKKTTSLTTTIKSVTTTRTKTTTTTLTSTTTKDTTTTNVIVNQSGTSEVNDNETAVVTETTVSVEDVSNNNDTSEPTPEYIVYKPSTHYVHRSTCRWVNSECQEITSTENIECRKCSECNPDIDIINEYNQPQVQPVSGGSALDYVSYNEYVYLCNTVGREYGSDCVPIYDKACVVAVVMNRVRDGGWSNGNPSTIYNVITAPYQFNPDYCTNYFQSCVTQSCKDAVDYYFSHQSEFPHYTSFCGDGRYNYFS